MMHRLLPFFLILPFTAQAIEIRQFDDPDKQQRYERLIEELRCLVCQNQSLADSDADLARDLRDEVYTIIQTGKNEEEAVKFLTDRYGDFVLYRPPFKMTTALLWIGPFLLLTAGGALLWLQVKRRSAADNLVELTDEEKKRLERLRNNLEG
ncbi:cytochrome c-type biogenesis protein [Methylocaldum sp. MU1018]